MDWRGGGVRRRRMSSRHGTSARRPAPTARSAAAAVRPATGSGCARHRREEDASSTGGAAPCGGAPPETRAGRVDRVGPQSKQRQRGRCGQGDITRADAVGDGLEAATLDADQLTVQIHTALDKRPLQIYTKSSLSIPCPTPTPLPIAQPLCRSSVLLQEAAQRRGVSSGGVV